MINSHHTQRGVGGRLPSRISCCTGAGRVGSGGRPWRQAGASGTEAGEPP